MDLLSIFQSLENSGPGTLVRQSIWMFPVIQCFHLLALALLGGSVLVLDLRMFGLGLQAPSTADLSRRLHPWMLAAWVTINVTGILMFLSEAIKCYYSPPFFYKMGFLLVASIYTFTYRRGVAVAEPGQVSAGKLKLTAALSMLLWFGVAFSGRWIAFY
jgi:hypothetical protein